MYVQVHVFWVFSLQLFKVSSLMALYPVRGLKHAHPTCDCIRCLEGKHCSALSKMPLVWISVGCCKKASRALRRAFKGMYSKVTGTYLMGTVIFLRMHLLCGWPFSGLWMQWSQWPLFLGDSGADVSSFAPGLLTLLRAHGDSPMEFFRNHEGVRQVN